MEPYWDSIKQIIKESDIVLEILDARAVELSRNEQLEKIINESEKPRIFVINKADLVSKEDLALGVEKLVSERNANRDFIVYFSNKNKGTVRNLLGRIRQIFGKFGKRKEFDEKLSPLIKKPYREAKGDIIVGVVGYPNVGKSSVINALSFKSKAKVSSKAGTTHGVHWITANKEIKLIDTPGVVPLAYVDESRLGIIAARGPEKLKDIELVAGKIIEQFMKEDKLEKFEKFYNFKISEEVKKENNAYIILEKLAIAKNHLKKGGLPDETRTGTIIVKDWQKGKLRL